MADPAAQLAVWLARAARVSVPGHTIPLAHPRGVHVSGTINACGAIIRHCATLKLGEKAGGQLVSFSALRRFSA